MSSYMGSSGFEIWFFLLWFCLLRLCKTSLW